MFTASQADSTRHTSNGAGISDVGLVGFRFNTIGVSDGMSMGTDGMSYSLQSRDLIADSIETVMSAQVRARLLQVAATTRKCSLSVLVTYYTADLGRCSLKPVYRGSTVCCSYTVVIVDYCQCLSSRSLDDETFVDVICPTSYPLQYSLEGRILEKTSTFAAYLLFQKLSSRACTQYLSLIHI